MKLTSIIAAAFATSAALTTIAAAESKGKMKNEWTVSKMAPKDGNTEAPAKTIMGSGSGAGKASFQDLSLVKKPTPDTPVQKKVDHQKMSLIKGESKD